MLPSFEELHRLSGFGWALLLHSLHLAVTHLFSACFPDAPIKDEGGGGVVHPPEWAGGRSLPEAAQLGSLSAGLGRAGPARVETVPPPSSALLLPHVLHAE